jgi:hypothetical protein
LEIGCIEALPIHPHLSRIQASVSCHSDGTDLRSGMSPAKCTSASNPHVGTYRTFSPCPSHHSNRFFPSANMINFEDMFEPMGLESPPNASQSWPHYHQMPGIADIRPLPSGSCMCQR